MRVIAGTLKGRRLKAPTWDGLRPTSDKLRETLFNILAPRIAGARVLDGYAGTGASASRRSAAARRTVTFVERDRRAQALIAENLAHCGDRRTAMLSSARRSRARSTLAARRRRSSRSTSSCSIRRTTSRRSTAMLAAGGDAAGAGRRASCSSTRAGAPAPEHGGPAGRVARRRVGRQRADVLRSRYFTHVHPRRLSRLVRSADQRPRRHHLARRAAVRPHHRRDPGERGEGAAVHDGRAGRDRARGVQGSRRTSRSTPSTACWSTTSSGAARR